MSAISELVVLRPLLRNCWPSLPALTVAAVLVSVAAVVPLVVAPGVNAVSVAVAVLVVGPALAGLVATVADVLDTGEVTMREAVRAVGQHAGLGVRAAVVPAVFAELFLAAWQLWTQHDTALLVPSLGLTGAATALSALLAAVVVTGGRADVMAWRTAAALVTLRPVRFLAVAAAAALAGWLVVAVSPVLLPLVPVPVAIVLVAAVRTTSADLAAVTGSPE